ncbi:SGNH/GDSL hydrolase family protein [Kribbella qitaiheensis]|uniref:SGNH/GDSL hydrolase family protein n=1 Tax=Kribbella qitaiheensis TaxID=1544730 RepID=UPI0019D678E0|nr:SGNH/GDSL hydrolase family protein [Kribbella qitaiheensis]
MISPGSRYVALGSSFAAGSGVKPRLDKASGRSQRNYAHLVAEALELDLVDVTYSGATTANVLSESQNDAPPQLGAIGPETELVTVTIGGNDLDYIGTFIRGSLMNTLARPVGLIAKRLGNRIRARVSYLKDQSEYDAAADSLTEIATQIRKSAPRSRILLVDYLTLVGPGTRPRLDVPLNEEQLPSVVMMAEGLAAAFAKAAERTDAELITASSASLDHAVGSPEPWTTGFRFVPFGGVPYHPNEAGMRAVADLIVNHLRANP